MMLGDAVHEALQCMHFERQAFIPESTVLLSPPEDPPPEVQPLSFDDRIK